MGISTGSVNAASSAALTPSLRLVSEPSYRISVHGRHWRPLSEVAFSVTQGSTVTGLALRATSIGTFIVGIKNINLCAGEVFNAWDLGGDHASIHGPALPCPVPLRLPKPELTVLKGEAIPLAPVHVDGPTGKTVQINIGNAIYVWQPGTKHPAYFPSVPSTYFALIGAGTTPPRACPEVECSQGFYWEWVGIHAGNSVVSMTPWCRRQKPVCEIASWVISVRILATPAASSWQAR
jgi:hypothetical protein